ncbi:MAG: hypothetical protein OEZ23_00340 [Gammaproteobacteria bacterium]|nr:hypothetical protein [Gammaproteobacteria bacterium]
MRDKFIANLTGFSFLLVVVVIFFGAIQIFKGELEIDTDLFFLMPASDHSSATQQLQERISREYGHQIVGVIEAESSIGAEEAMEAFLEKVRSKGILQARDLDKDSEGFESLITSLVPFRFELLASEDRRLLQTENHQALLARAIKELHQPGSSPRWLPLADDPLNLFSHYLIEVLPEAPGEVAGYFILKEQQGRTFAFCFLDSGNASMDLSSQGVFLHYLDTLKNEVERSFPEVTLVFSGLDIHIAEAASQSKDEVTLITTASLFMVFLIFFFSFRSLKPLLFGFLSLGTGILFAISTSLFLFEKIHIFTLLFGASLIGVAIDYALHHIVIIGLNHQKQDKWTLERGVRNASFLGLISTLIAYGFLLQSDLPGLIQIAFFSISGLIASWIFVSRLYSRWPIRLNTAPLSRENSLLSQSARLALKFWLLIPRSSGQWLALFLMIVSSLIVYMLSNPVREASMLYRPSADLLARDHYTREVTSPPSPNQYFLLSGASIDALISTESQLAYRLDKAVSDRNISGYQTFFHYFPPIDIRQNNYLLARSLYLGDGAVALDLLSRIGVKEDRINSAANAYTQAQLKPLDPESFLAEAKDQFPFVWFDQESRTYFSVIFLFDVRDKASLSKIAEFDEDWLFVDRVQDINTSFYQQFDRAILLLLIAVPVLILGAIFWHRAISAAMIVMVPVIAMLTALSLLIVLGYPISLFHIFGLYLVLGLGLDYSFFVYRATEQLSASLKTIFLSGITSSASFGFLSFSSTPMVSAFGQVVFLGSVLNVLLVPLLVHFKPSNAAYDL